MLHVLGVFDGGDYFLSLHLVRMEGRKRVGYRLYKDRGENGQWDLTITTAHALLMDWGYDYTIGDLCSILSFEEMVCSILCNSQKVHITDSAAGNEKNASGEPAATSTGSGTAPITTISQLKSWLSGSPAAPAATTAKEV